ncbi:MAG TPA: S8 family serine peptidase [Longimicrobium sp.]|nr:S8 family serine peptidase [Longimicrobium sp.]
MFTDSENIVWPRVIPDAEPVRELIVVARADAGLHATGTDVASTTGAAVGAISLVLRDAGACMEPLFGDSEAQVRALGTVPGGERGPIDLSLFYRVYADDRCLDDVARVLGVQEAVEAAYVKPAAYLPALYLGQKPRVQHPPAVTPDFTQRQGYLFAAPQGVDALHAWAMPGGGGSGVRIVDVEGAWIFNHEDLRERQGGVIAGTERSNPYVRNHGTSAAGIVSGDANGYGVTGISPDAVISGASIYPRGTAYAIRAAADHLAPGDVILLELHRPGPAVDFDNPDDPFGWMAVEWWPDDFAAIRYATRRGVLVVEAAGNGAQDLDDPIYDVHPAAPHGPFPSWWSNPFRRGGMDSGAILVGAGAPPQGTHGRDLWGPDRSRLDYSCYGSVVDAQGWGWEVTTAGWYGDLQGGPHEARWYTDGFGGTSAAAPIVAGALACVQGALSAAARPRLTPVEARGLLRRTGSPQQNGPAGPATQRIGNRPDVREMLSMLLPYYGRALIDVPAALTPRRFAGAGAM